MYRFLMPRPDMTTLDIAIGSRDLAGAFEQFREFWWQPDMSRTIGVWNGAALIAVVMPGADGEPVLDLIPRY